MIFQKTMQQILKKDLEKLSDRYKREYQILCNCFFPQHKHKTRHSIFEQVKEEKRLYDKYKCDSTTMADYMVNLHCSIEELSWILYERK